mmetsp:Transcript_14282/g.26222  ORF Transcript_14282/g.26222 Transcript_14282/m.26222 type:complete len:211 (+) Transcript_14282:17198-17830(+)
MVYTPSHLYLLSVVLHEQPPAVATFPVLVTVTPSPPASVMKEAIELSSLIPWRCPCKESAAFMVVSAMSINPVLQLVPEPTTAVPTAPLVGVQAIVSAVEVYPSWQKLILLVPESSPQVSKSKLRPKVPVILLSTQVQAEPTSQSSVVKADPPFPVPASAASLLVMLTLEKVKTIVCTSGVLTAPTVTVWISGMSLPWERTSWTSLTSEA